MAERTLTMQIIGTGVPRQDDLDAVTEQVTHQITGARTVHSRDRVLTVTNSVLDPLR